MGLHQKCPAQIFPGSVKKGGKNVYKKNGIMLTQQWLGWKATKKTEQRKADYDKEKKKGKFRRKYNEAWTLFCVSGNENGVEKIDLAIM